MSPQSQRLDYPDLGPHEDCAVSPLCQTIISHLVNGTFRPAQSNTLLWKCAFGCMIGLQQYIGPRRWNSISTESPLLPSVQERVAIMAASRPLVNVYSLEGEVTEQVQLPAVFTAPIRPDIVQFVHAHMMLNSRQPYAVSPKAGKQTSAESWGTGRAVSRIPRVPGGGTHRAGQGAFGNMCRGGRMFAPTKVWRKWHRKTNRNMRRYAVVSAIAASAVPSLVMARGHRIGQVPEIPLVVDDGMEGLTKTKDAVVLLKKLGAAEDAEKAKRSRHIRKGKGKMRNRRHVVRKGPLVIYGSDSGVVRAFRNLPGLNLRCVDRLHLCQVGRV